MPAYNRTLFDPPAPFVYIQIRNPATGKEWEQTPMLLDSGADVTLVPREIGDALGALPMPDMAFEVAGFDGQSRLTEVVYLALTFCKRRFRGQYLLTDEPWGIIGRNLLNRVALVFDGPNLRWEER
ncbi:MAG: hypothetical protein DYG89_42005 [Caldilinea sp. CFX5]|nr:hypothetical protein [Caldilinea sp. CFX5]